MRLLTIDIGNNKIVAGLVEGDRLLDSFHSGHQDLLGAASTPAARAAAVYDWCMEKLVAGEKDERITAISVASVVPPVLELWMHLWKGKDAGMDLPMLVISGNARFPFELEIHQPSTIGADRLCNIAGACLLGYEKAIVVDLGSANTFDLLWEGKFVGGLIGPGCHQSHQALLKGGAQLPEIPFGRPSTIVGMDTRQAIAAGSFHQAVGGIRHVIELLLTEQPGCVVLVLGGMAELVAPELDLPVLYQPSLTLLGAAEIYRCSADLV